MRLESDVLEMNKSSTELLTRKQAPHSLADSSKLDPPSLCPTFSERDPKSVQQIGNDKTNSSQDSAIKLTMDKVLQISSIKSVRSAKEKSASFDLCSLNISESSIASLYRKRHLSFDSADDSGRVSVSDNDSSKDRYRHKEFLESKKMNSNGLSSETQPSERCMQLSPTPVADPTGNLHDYSQEKVLNEVDKDDDDDDVTIADSRDSTSADSTCYQQRHSKMLNPDAVATSKECLLESAVELHELRQKAALNMETTVSQHNQRKIKRHARSLDTEYKFHRQKQLSESVDKKSSGEDSPSLDKGYSLGMAYHYHGSFPRRTPGHRTSAKPYASSSTRRMYSPYHIQCDSPIWDVAGAAHRNRFQSPNNNNGRYDHLAFRGQMFPFGQHRKSGPLARWSQVSSSVQ